MSIRQGKKLIASSTTNGFNLFDCKWADHILNNISWLRADTFSWQSGDVYVAAYNHLTEEWNAWWATHTAADLQFDGDLAYAIMPDGHRICGGYASAAQEQEGYLIDIYNNKGVAWYYLIDDTNRQFKLPRTKWGFTGLRDSVGGYVAPGLPNITGSFSTASDKNLGNGAFSWTTNKYSTNGGGQGGQWGINFSAQKSNAIYGNSTTVQPPATQMYLYFYVGNFAQSAIEQTAGLNAEMFNDLNAHKVIVFQAPTSANNYTWYRKYADGWVEQGGLFTNSAKLTQITFPIVMADTNYCALSNLQYGSETWSATVTTCIAANTRTTTGMQILCYYNNSYNTGPICWKVEGMAA